MEFRLPTLLDPNAWFLCSSSSVEHEFITTAEFDVNGINFRRIRGYDRATGASGIYATSLTNLAGVTTNDERLVCVIHRESLDSCKLFQLLQ